MDKETRYKIEILLEHENPDHDTHYWNVLALDSETGAWNYTKVHGESQTIREAFEDGLSAFYKAYENYEI